jgi:hypothetical protein
MAWVVERRERRVVISSAAQRRPHRAAVTRPAHAGVDYVASCSYKAALTRQCSAPIFEDVTAFYKALARLSG